MSTVCGECEFTEEHAKKAAEMLKDAMDGLGTNEEKIVEVLVNHNNEQRQVIKETYAAAYGKPLVDDLISELTGDLEETMVALCMPPRDLDAKLLHDAMCGVGTQETMLIGVLCTRSNCEIECIKEAYKKLYDVDLVEDLQGDTSGYFGRFMYSLASGARQEGMADYDRAEEEAQKLVDAGVGQCGTDECDFNAVLCLSSHEQLQCVFQKYEEKREGKTVEEDIKSEVSSDVQEGYLSIVKVARNKYEFYADWLYNATTGVWGTEDSELIGIIVSRSEEDLQYIKDVFEKKYETSLYDTVASECGGYYKRCLLSLISGQYVGPE